MSNNLTKHCIFNGNVWGCTLYPLSTHLNWLQLSFTLCWIKCSLLMFSFFFFLSLSCQLVNCYWVIVLTVTNMTKHYKQETSSFSARSVKTNLNWFELNWIQTIWETIVKSLPFALATLLNQWYSLLFNSVSHHLL